jgi:LysR family glycine cleavage system transcriptional activator
MESPIYLNALRAFDASAGHQSFSAAVLQAAIEVRGMALGRSVMAKDDIASGRLLRLFPEIEFTSALVYFVVYRAESSSLPRIVAFRDWIMTEAAAK